MVWSTKQVAELAGTTVKAVRHYHEIGLLDQPDRTSNGYKLYDVTHLVSLLRITRLTDLGVPLAQVAALSEPDADPEETLRDLDAELDVTIGRLVRVRGEIALILGHQSSTDLPADIGPAVADMSESDKSLLLVYSRLFAVEEVRDLRQNLVDLRQGSAHQEFDLLPDDADEGTRQRLAEEYAAHLRILSGRYPWMAAPGSRALRGRAFAAETIEQSIRDIYNCAQIDVLHRVQQILS